MKYLFTFLLCLSAFVCSSQDSGVNIPIDDKGAAVFTEVVEVPGSTKDALYMAAIAWINKTYRSPKDVLQTGDKEGGVIIGRALTGGLTYKNVITNVEAGSFRYSFTIQVKDGKYKFTIDEIKYQSGKMMLREGADLGEAFPSNWSGTFADSKQGRREWQNMRKQASTSLLSTIAGLKESMSKGTASEW